jgi:hypothetical protein
LDEELNRPVVGLFLFRGKETGRDLAALPVIMQALATDAVLVARICTRTILFVDFGPGALVFLLHLKHLRQQHLRSFQPLKGDADRTQIKT